VDPCDKHLNAPIGMSAGFRAPMIGNQMHIIADAEFRKNKAYNAFL